MSSPTVAIIGGGANPTTLSYNGGSGAVLIAELLDVQFPNQTVGNAEATRYDSPDTYEEFIPGYKNGGEIDAEANYVATQAAALMTTLLGSVETWVITLPDGKTITFKGFINGSSGQIPMKTVIKQKIKIKVTGKPTLA